MRERVLPILRVDKAVEVAIVAFVGAEWNMDVQRTNRLVGKRCALLRCGLLQHADRVPGREAARVARWGVPAANPLLRERDSGIVRIGLVKGRWGHVAGVDRGWETFAVVERSRVRTTRGGLRTTGQPKQAARTLAALERATGIRAVQ